LDTVRRLVGRVAGELGAPPDLAALFVTRPHAPAFGEAARVVRAALRPATLLGCVAESVVGTARQVEQGPGAALWAARLGPVAPVAVEVAGASGPVSGWPTHPGFEPRGLVLVACPWSFPAGGFLAWLETAMPGLPVVGGMAWGGGGPGSTRLSVDGRLQTIGAVGALVGAGAGLSSVVAPGVGALGDAVVVTRAEGPVIHELAGKPPLARLEAWGRRDLDPHRVDLVNRGGLRVGRVVNEHRDAVGPGDVELLGIRGVDRRTGALVVDEPVPVGTTVQFHLRDPAVAETELRAAVAGRRARGALLFTDTDRAGSRSGRDHDDASVVTRALHTAPLGGFLAAGELGRLGEVNRHHRQAAVVALFGTHDP
ncbi:MAG TPA: FIST N-terminal domain-containing protein, partial [Acidimicrobiales bacterium]|nr:FIST N-terminal domain-containing protein [Acidimicrobiales bacterium]